MTFDRSRRNFLEIAAKVLAGTTILGVTGCATISEVRDEPLEVIAKAVDTRPIVNIQAYIERIPGDRISDSFYSNEDGGMFNGLMEEITNFFEPHINIQYNLLGDDQPTTSELSNRNIAFHLGSIENLCENTLDLLPQIIEEGITKKDLILKLMTEAKMDYESAEKALNRVFLDYAKKSEIYGYGNSGVHKAMVFNKPVFNDSRLYDSEVISLYAFTAFHEIGHTLGLEHSNNKGYKLSNFMNSGNTFDDVKRGHVTIHPEQVQQMYQFLGHQQQVISTQR
jgi:hypothetical protein